MENNKKRKYKTLNYENLKKQDRAMFPKKTIFIDDYKIVIDKKFKQSKINKIIEELIEKEKYARIKELNFNIITMQYLYMIKYFTSVYISNQYERQIQELDWLCDQGYFEKILNEFNQDEINKINQSFIKIINNASKMISEAKDEIKEFNNNARL